LARARHVSRPAAEVLAHAGENARRHDDLLARARRRNRAMEREHEHAEDEDVHERLAEDARGPAARSYQMGAGQARSWIVRATAGSVHDDGRSGGASALHWIALQRQLGFSSTRA